MVLWGAGDEREVVTSYIMMDATAMSNVTLAQTSRSNQIMTTFNPYRNVKVFLDEIGIQNFPRRSLSGEDNAF